MPRDYQSRFRKVQPRTEESPPVSAPENMVENNKKNLWKALHAHNIAGILIDLEEAMQEECSTVPESVLEQPQQVSWLKHAVLTEEQKRALQMNMVNSHKNRALKSRITTLKHKSKEAIQRSIENIIHLEIGHKLWEIKKYIHLMQLTEDKDIYSKNQREAVKKMVYIHSRLASLIYTYFMKENFVVELETVRQIFRKERLHHLPEHFLIPQRKEEHVFMDNGWQQSFTWAVSQAIVITALKQISHKFKVYELENDHDRDIFDLNHQTDIILYEKRKGLIYLVDVKTNGFKHYAEKIEPHLHYHGFRDPAFIKEIERVAKSLGRNWETSLTPVKIRFSTGVNTEMFTWDKDKFTLKWYVDSIVFRLKEMSGNTTILLHSQKEKRKQFKAK